MRFFKNLYISALAVVAGAAALTSCQPEESPLSRAIMTSVSGVQFAAQNAEPQTITVYADADWTVEAPEWVTVDKTSGTRTMEVTISVGDNMRDGAIDNPKKDTIVFRGYNLLGTAYVIVNQDGDKFRDVPPVAVSDVLSMKDEAVVIFDEVQVVAAATNGFVVSDGAADVFVVSDATVAVGDKVDIWGSKGTANGLAAVTVCDKVEVTGNAAVTYPTTTDITSSLDAYAPTKMEYVEVTGSIDGVNVSVEGATKVAAVYNPTSAFDLAALNGHNVTVKGYSAGATASLVNVIATEIVDLGVNEIIYFTDNFDWVADLAASSGAGDSMGTNGDDAAKNAYTAVSGFAELLASQGYEDLFPSSKTIYLQRNYLKFSKGSNTNGIRFPSITYGGTTNVVLTFDWGVHVGSGGQDQTELMIEIEGNGTVDQTTFTHVAGEWEWQTETVTITGVDDNTRIVLKPTKFTGVVDSGYYRWYLDNIKVIQGEGEAPAPPAPKPETPLHAEWLFSADAMTAYADNFGGTTGVADTAEGDGGMYVNANVAGNGKLTFVQIDKTTLDADAKAKRIVGSTGHPTAYGVWPGDYWLFEATDGYAYPANTSVSIKFITRVSKTGMRYWRLEYIDGTEWKPAMPTTKETINGTEAEYNIAMNEDGSTNVEVDTMVTLTAPTKDIKFRMLCVANAQANGGAALEKPNGGTCRIAGAEGTSPVIQVVE
jgi:hypothetical protein